jgi:hypothetical protein
MLEFTHDYWPPQMLELTHNPRTYSQIILKLLPTIALSLFTHNCSQILTTAQIYSQMLI